ncbi:hypothetical protein XI07_09725 [Bradyrhizobium sp. CCBAU 11445]|nr:hypothetical protein [Bradyrhizobium sp. CCBAU 11445]MDA9522788.1 hypothetical protein [Bradyrhizobium sp. CCBAU 11434]
MIRTFRFARWMHLDLLYTQDWLRCRPKLETLGRIRLTDERRRNCIRRKWFALMDSRNALKDAIAERAHRHDRALHFRQQ